MLFMFIWTLSIEKEQQKVQLFVTGFVAEVAFVAN